MCPAQLNLENPQNRDASDTIVLRRLGTVRDGRADPIDDAWDSVEAVIELDASHFKRDATASLDAFSHIEVVFHFNQVPDDEINTGARHPRGRKDWPLVGIFAQRGKGRPNRIGVTVCRLLSVEGLQLNVRGDHACARCCCRAAPPPLAARHPPDAIS
jgi:tRNA (Thr-GGU) A37 N-methylase